MASKFLSLSFLLFFFPIFIFAQVNLIYSKVDIDILHSKIKDLASLGLDLNQHGILNEKHLIGIFSNLELNKITEAGVEFKVIIEDVQAYYRMHGTMEETEIEVPSRNNYCDNSKKEYEVPRHYSQDGSMGGYLTYTQAMAELDKMHDLYPELITERLEIGNIRTHTGLNLHYLILSDNPYDLENEEPQILYNSLHHGREPNSLSQLIFYMWYLLENYESDEEVKYLVNNSAMYFMPVINPDGYIHNELTNPNGGGLWRKNRYSSQNGTVGVDLNRNYAFNWGLDNSGSSPDETSQTYRGVAPFSEPETQAVKKLCEDNRFQIAMNCHASGDLLIYPWGYSNQLTEQHVTYNSLSEAMTEENEFKIGTVLQTLGYLTNGSSDDWMYGDTINKQSIFSFTPEVGRSFWPAQHLILDLNKSMLRMNLNAAHLLHNFGWVKDINPSEIAEPLEGEILLEFQKSGLIDDPIDLTIVPITAGLSLSNTSHSLDMIIGEKKNMTIEYEIPPSYLGETLEFEIWIDNGLFINKVRFSKCYTPTYPLTKEESLLISPNPTNGEIKILTASCKFYNQTQLEYKIVDELGREIQNGNVNLIDGTIDTSILPKGIFFLQLTYVDEIITIKKVIKY